MMPRRAEVGQRTVWFYVDGHVLHAAAKLVRSPRQYDPQRRAWTIPRAFLDDVLAALELQFGVDVQVEQVDR